ncbi:MAG: hypothetical protein H6607_13430 [Flavobacteriales bacterium]|nr:hypothetical protein [Flavobacteriales bacterium]
MKKLAVIVFISLVKVACFAGQSFFKKDSKWQPTFGVQQVHSSPVEKFMIGTKIYPLNYQLVSKKNPLRGGPSHTLSNRISFMTNISFELGIERKIAKNNLLKFSVNASNFNNTSTNFSNFPIPYFIIDETSILKFTYNYQTISAATSYFFEQDLFNAKFRHRMGIGVRYSYVLLTKYLYELEYSATEVAHLWDYDLTPNDKIGRLSPVFSYEFRFFTSKYLDFWIMTNTTMFKKLQLPDSGSLNPQKLPLIQHSCVGFLFQCKKPKPNMRIIQLD